MKWIGRILGLVVLAYLGWWSWQHFFVTEEQRVQRLLTTTVTAVEHGDVMKLDDCIAVDYTDDFGFDKSTLIGGVRAFRSQYEAIFIHLSDVTITVEPDHQKAQATFIAKILTKARGALGTSDLRQDRFHVIFRKTDTGWKLVRAESPELKFE